MTPHFRRTDDAAGGRAPKAGPSRTWRIAARVGAAMAVDAVLAVGSFWLALSLRFDGAVPDTYAMRLRLVLLPLVAVLLVTETAGRAHRSVPRYASVPELVRVGIAAGVTVAFFLGLAGLLMPGEHFLPLSVPLISGPILVVALGGVRLSRRLRADFVRRSVRRADSERVLIVGAGDAGELVARDMLQDPGHKLLPIGFVDDDPARWNQRIHGVRVLGSLDDLEAVLEQSRPDHVLIAMPGVSGRVVRPILHRVVATGVKVKILPGLRELMEAPVSTAVIRDVDVADLIGREPVKIDSSELARRLEGRTVLVTGAAGSIGSELARQVLRFRPGRLLLLDNNETDVFDLLQELEPMAGPTGSSDLEMIVGDIRDRRRVDHIFSTRRPHIVFHAAAYKHVPVMEPQAAEAIKTNVMGTEHVARAAAASGTERFVLVSTDKAVRPVSVMGATKRVAELVVEQVAREAGTVFATVRFGNVLGSRGSVVPLFTRQIREGGPITVTHPEVTRYFMTIDEAASLILQAGLLATGGETFVLDMGEPVRILTLAERMRDLLGPGAGPGPDHEEIEIAFTGLRPGEKLHEDLWQEGESLVPTSHPRILRAIPPQPRWGPGAGAAGRKAFESALHRLQELAIWNAEAAEIRDCLLRLTNPPTGSAGDDPIQFIHSVMSDTASSQN